ncbi:MAG TPA: hypothetical protein VFR43_13175 [Gaiellaceae bacterium]|nr:hypothetical protein [Gaiellaceae bacterium]
MTRRLVVLAAVALLALGLGVAVWASSREGSAPSACPDATVTLEDTQRPNLMTYHGRYCGDDR